MLQTYRHNEIGIGSKCDGLILYAMDADGGHYFYCDNCKKEITEEAEPLMGE